MLKNKKILFVVAKLLLLAAIFSYLFHNIKFDDFIDSFSRFYISGYFLSMGACFVSCLVLAHRWVYILKNKISVIDGLESTMICLGLNNILPGKAGEFIKIIYLKKIASLHISFALPMMMIERLLDVFVLFLFVVFGSLSNDNLDYRFILVVLLIAGFAITLIAFRWEFFIKKTYIIKQPNVRRFIANLIKAVARVKVSEFLILLAYTLVLWALYFIYFYIFVSYGADFNLSFYEAIVVFVFISIGMAIPLSPGGVGTVHAGAVLSLGWFGIDKTDALAFGIIFHLVQFLPTSILGLVLSYRRFTFDIFKSEIPIVEEKT